MEEQIEEKEEIAATANQGANDEMNAVKSIEEEEAMYVSPDVVPLRGLKVASVN